MIYRIPFTKMNGTGNDFIFAGVKDIEEGKIDAKDLACKVCHRHFGIGADGLVLIDKLEDGESFRFEIYNSDGSRAAICGNALRCAAIYCNDKYFAAKAESITFYTDSGEKKATISSGLISINMGEARQACETAKPIVYNGIELIPYIVSIGNRHLIFQMDSIKEVDIISFAKQVLRTYSNDYNIHIIKENKDGSLTMRTFERGAGQTLACGSGACAVFHVWDSLGKVKEKLSITQPGGIVFLSRAGNGEIILAGPAEYNAEGIFFYNPES